MTDESNIGLWLWAGLLLVVNAYWISADLWLHKHHHEMLTDEFREGLANPFWGPLLAFLTFGTVASFVFHMYIAKSPGGTQ